MIKRIPPTFKEKISTAATQQEYDEVNSQKAYFYIIGIIKYMNWGQIILDTINSLSKLGRFASKENT